MACSSSIKKRVVMEYDAHCDLCMDSAQVPYKDLPMIADSGRITIYDDSIRFEGPAELDFVLGIIDFNGTPLTSRVMCITEKGEPCMIMVSQQTPSLRYEVYVFTEKGGHYFDIYKVL